jgi:hypothetical protein
MSWTKAEEQRLKDLSITGKFFYSEIAMRLKKKGTEVRYKAKKMNLASNPCPARKGKWNQKHSHIAEAVMTYFLTHSSAECQKKFRLTASEFKSLMTSGYRKVSLSHLRKDSRTHAPWTTEDWLFAVQRAGLIERKVIAFQMGRTSKGAHHAIKDRFAQSGGGGTKFLNGMPIGWANSIWPADIVTRFALKTQAGPSGGVRANFRLRLIPWVVAERLASAFRTPNEITRCIRAMARFQRFVHRRKDAGIISQIKKITKTTGASNGK